IELLRARLGPSMGPDEAARLHEITEGWPLGLQLALSVMAASADPRAELAALAARRGAVREQFIGLMLANLAPEDLALLTRLAVFEQIHPGLCEVVAQDPAAPERLARLARDTPVFTAGEASDWMRMHSIARDELRRRFAQLPAAEQAALHARAGAWLAEHGMVEAAARHALAAGLNDLAYELAERSLYESVMSRGRHGAVLEWLSRAPAAEIDQRPRLLLAAAWTLALSDRHEEARRYVERILARPGVDDALRCECALILGGAAVFADDLDRFAALHDPWAGNPPLRDPALLGAHTNRSAFRLLIEGEPAQARQRQQQGPQGDFGAALGYVAHWGEWITGLGYLWEGQVRLAEGLLRPALARTDAELGRRNPFACTMAAALAAALWERDAPAEAAAALANRLDVLEHGGLPEAVLLGFRTMARIAGAEGAEHRAFELLGALEAVAVARRLPRLRLASLAEQVRLHSHRFRHETCRELCGRIDALLADPASPSGRLWRRSTSLLREVALGHAEIGAREWRRAGEALARADALAQSLKLGRLHIELLGLRAWALDRSGERSLDMLREAAGLARTFGLERVFVDAHPGLGDWVRDALAERTAPGESGPGPLAAPIRPAQPPGAAERLRSTPSMALTPKEREVLELLARNLSNKEIGLAMQVGETTVKWHMKNLFAKLDAGTRKQLVQRARLLGLLETRD
ncbi:MAG: LuxR family transcriptional regulator, partial [Burkholderiales bacterium]|nr:LuxR family transcriptional regulator [Burkholderiales bacterium]